MNADAQKRRAAERALDYVRPGMTLGLGTGSTAARFVELLGVRVGEGLSVTGVATSEATRKQAEEAGIPLTTLEETPRLDLTVDGADELDGRLRLIKGGGGALLREKIVAAASARMVVVATDDKLVKTLGAFPLPVEIDRFGTRATRALVEAAARDAGCAGEIALRREGEDPFVSDGGNYILDCAFGRIPDPEALDAALSGVPGVVGHGLFLGLARAAIVAGPETVNIIGEAP